MKGHAAPADEVTLAASLEGRMASTFTGEVAHNFAHGSDAGCECDTGGVAEGFASDAFKKFCQDDCCGAEGGGTG